MNLLNKNALPSILAGIFLIGIIFISYKMWLGSVLMLLILLLIYFTNQKYRFLISIFISFLVSFVIFQLTNVFFERYDFSKEIRVLMNRGFLIIIIVGLLITHHFKKEKFSFFHQKPKWNNRIYLPFHSIKISYFLLIGLLINAASFTPFIVQQELSQIKSILLFCILFSIINGLLEEILWRGILLSSLREHVSVVYAVLITSLGFGLQHIAIGFPLYISILFSIGGFFYAFVVLKTNSIYPAIVFHIFINICMVLSGMIL